MSSTRSGRQIVAGMMIATPALPWKLILPAAAEDSAATISDDTSGYDYVQQEGAANLIDLQAFFGNSFSAIILAFYGAPGAGPEDPEDQDTFSFDLVGYRNIGDVNPPLLICNTAAAGGILGTLEKFHATEAQFWADSITLSKSDWVGDVAVYDHGDDRVALLAFDAVGLRYLLINRFGVAGTDEAPQIGVVGAAF